MTLIREFYKRNIPVIDFSGDFRFRNLDDYAVYAKNRGMEDTHLSRRTSCRRRCTACRKNSPTRSGRRSIVGNSGCFAICMTLGLLPAVESGIIASGTIICDGKSGVSGAGKSSGEANLYPQRHENVNTYREGKHQHLVEVENVLNDGGRNGRQNPLRAPGRAPQPRDTDDQLHGHKERARYRRAS